MRLADGSPIVLLLLALFAQYDADIDKLVDRLAELEPGRRHEHLLNEVLSAFTPEMLATTLAAAAIPSASLEDVSAATGIRHATPIVDRLLRLPGFISSETGAYQTHPLLLAALRTRYGPDLSGTLFRAARQYERAGEFLRAAELYNAYGDEEAAATALDLLPAATLQYPAPRLIDVLARIEVSTLCAVSGSLDRAAAVPAPKRRTGSALRGRFQAVADRSKPTRRQSLAAPLARSPRNAGAGARKAFRSARSLCKPARRRRPRMRRTSSGWF